MQIGMVGLGRMGGNMARRLMKGGHEVVGFATDPAAVEALANDGGSGTTNLDEFVNKLKPPRVAWVMVPAGAATEQVVADLAKRMQAGDTIVDGGNSMYKDDVRRSKAFTLHPDLGVITPTGLHTVSWARLQRERGKHLEVGVERGAADRAPQGGDAEITR